MNRRGLLLVEDNPDEIELARAALARVTPPLDLTICDDGEEALDWLFKEGRHHARAGPLPAVVLLDLKLPGIDGIEVLRRIRSDPRTRPVPVVVMTSSVEARDLRKGYDAGANSYVRKPVDFDDFVTAIQQIASYWGTLNEAVPDEERS